MWEHTDTTQHQTKQAMADAEPTVHPPSPKEPRRIRDFLAGLKEFCENKEEQIVGVLPNPNCTHNVPEEDMMRLLYDVTIMHVPYEYTEFAEGMRKESVPVTTQMFVHP